MNKETVTFIPASELGFSDEGWEDINNSSNITFGNANLTIYTAEKLNEYVEFDNPDDEQILLDLIELDPMTYIDLEN